VKVLPFAKIGIDLFCTGKFVNTFFCTEKFVKKIFSIGKFSALGNLWGNFQHWEICGDIFSIGKFVEKFLALEKFWEIQH